MNAINIKKYMIYIATAIGLSFLTGCTGTTSVSVGYGIYGGYGYPHYGYGGGYYRLPHGGHPPHGGKPPHRPKPEHPISRPDRPSIQPVTRPSRPMGRPSGMSRGRRR